MKKPSQSKQKAEKQIANYLLANEFNNALIKRMSDKPLPWPHCAANARDRSAEELQHIVVMLTPVLEEDLDLEEIRIRISRALTSAHIALRHLEGQGAQTRPY
jgi:hypothetical protein